MTSAITGTIASVSSDSFQFRYIIQHSRPMTVRPSLTIVTSASVQAFMTWLVS